MNQPCYYIVGLRTAPADKVCTEMAAGVTGIGRAGLDRGLCCHVSPLLQADQLPELLEIDHSCLSVEAPGLNVSGGLSLLIIFLRQYCRFILLAVRSDGPMGGWSHTKTRCRQIISIVQETGYCEKKLGTRSAKSNTKHFCHCLSGKRLNKGMWPAAESVE